MLERKVELVRQRIRDLTEYRPVAEHTDSRPEMELVAGRTGLRPELESVIGRTDHQMAVEEGRQDKQEQLPGQLQKQEPEHRILEWEAQRTMKKQQCEIKRQWEVTNGNSRNKYLQRRGRSAGVRRRSRGGERAREKRRSTTLDKQESSMCAKHMFLKETYRNWLLGSAAGAGAP